MAGGPGFEKDRDLVTRFARGDEEAFSILYDRHTPAIYRTVVRIFNLTTPEAEDIVQEVWLRTAQGLSSFGWKSVFRTWLIGIALNCSREYVRRHHSKRRAHEHATIPSESANSAPLADRVDLERAYRQLPEGSRKVLFLHDVEGMTHGEIGTLLGLSEGTSRSQLFKARLRLRRLLSPQTNKGQERTHARR